MQEEASFGVNMMHHATLQANESHYRSVKMFLSVSPPVQSTSPVHLSSPVIVDSRRYFVYLFTLRRKEIVVRQLVGVVSFL